MGISVLKEFRPSLKEEFLLSWYQAKGLRPPFFWEFGDKAECYICGRKKDYLFNFTKLIYYFDISLENKLVYICDDHGRITNYDCTTGEPIELPLPRPYWQRRLRNTVQWIILNLAYIARFVWFFDYNLFMWYAAIYAYYWYRQCKKS